MNAGPELKRYRVHATSDMGDVPSAMVDVYLASDVDALLAELGRDAERLNWLDKRNASLNAQYGTTYRWKLILNHNVNRLFVGPHAEGKVGWIDLQDATAGYDAHDTVREALDAAMKANT